MSFDDEFLIQSLAFTIARISAEKAIQELVVVTPADISGALRSGSSLIALIKELTDIANKIGNTELIKTIADLNLEVAQGNLKLADLTNQLADLKNELRRKNEELSSKLSETLAFRDGVYYKASGEDAYCPKCFGEHNLVKLGRTEAGGKVISYKCHTCNWAKSALPE